ncbi:unnamed protein product [Didymodactylos carnosus]|uniref:Uncharacterized protein n=1 Tax=Didymodactylos carnosus TaxID=1234261 RepID=A0A814H735_9BILA|nr:unnamed protein product [Didymodactylos carnosus]CAF3776606.1 unnamed protein product [Didymodactylos carnosus]
MICDILTHNEQSLKMRNDLICQLELIKDDLKLKMKEEGYVELDLDQWTKQLEQLKSDIEKTESEMKGKSVEIDIDVCRLLNPMISIKVDEETKINLDQFESTPDSIHSLGLSNSVMGASDSLLLLFGLIEKSDDGKKYGNDQFQIYLTHLDSGIIKLFDWDNDNNGEVLDICWSSVLNQFLLLSSNSILTLNISTGNVTNIYQRTTHNKFVSFTVFEDILFVANGETILELLITNGVLIKDWNIFNNDSEEKDKLEYTIQYIRCSKSATHLDMIVHSQRDFGDCDYRLDVRDSSTMEMVYSFTLENDVKYVYNIVSISKDQWFILYSRDERCHSEGVALPSLNILNNNGRTKFLDDGHFYNLALVKNRLVQLTTHWQILIYDL